MNAPARFTAPIGALALIAGLAAGQGAAAETIRSAPLAPAGPGTQFQQPPPLPEHHSKALPLPRRHLSSAWTDKTGIVAQIAERNLGGYRPFMDGTTRAFDQPLALKYAPQAKLVSGEFGEGELFLQHAKRATWSTRIRVDDAWRLRLALAIDHWPEGLHLWVRGHDGETVGPFGNELLDPDGTLWTPSVAGPELELIASFWTDSDFDISMPAVMELFELDRKGEPTRMDADKGSCSLNSSCIGSGTFSSIDQARGAIGRIQFVVGNSGFVCTGGLVNDTDTSGTIPYFLTANHCFDSQASASSLEVFFDYSTNGCGGAAPSLGSRPRSNGATLLATSAATDFTLVQLNSIPGGRFLLGWTTSTVPVGTTVHRVSHPGGMPQDYSQTRSLSTNIAACTGRGTGNYLYSDALSGSTAGGSSGSPALLDNGQIVGQLFGACGPNPEDSCDTRNRTLDGRFRNYFALIDQFLDPQAAPAADLIATDTILRTEIAEGGVIVITPTAGQDLFPHVLFSVETEQDELDIFLRIRWDNQAVCEGTVTVGTGFWAAWCNSPLTMTSGSHTLSGVLDPNNQLSEGDETNNETSRPYQVAASIDLSATEVQLRTEPSLSGTVVNSPTVGQELYLTLRYTVDSPQDIELIRRLSWDGQPVCDVNVLVGAGDWIGWCDNPVTMTAGSHTLAGRLDPGNQIAETNESNNVRSKGYTVTSGGGTASIVDRIRSRLGETRDRYDGG